MGSKQQKQQQKNKSSTKVEEKESMNFNMNNIPMLGISLVIARNKQGKFLTVKENGDQGWWLPGGLVDPPEDFVTAGIRETLEEAGIDVRIKGVLRIEQNMKSNLRYKAVLYAEPIDEKQIPKQIPDSESQEARWVSLNELKLLGKSPPYLRGNELLEFGEYLEEGGQIYPLEIISQITTIKKKIVQQEQDQLKKLQQQQIQQPQASQLLKNSQIPKKAPIPYQAKNQLLLVQMLGLSLVVVRNSQGQWLAIKESRNRGWWLPGGKVDPPEDFVTAAKREVKEEGGIDIQIKGVLRVESNLSNGFLRYKVVFYAEPIDQSQQLKIIPDHESELARWVTLKELELLGKSPPYLRGSELVEFGNYIEKGGVIFPLSIIQATIS